MHPVYVGTQNFGQNEIMLEAVPSRYLLLLDLMDIFREVVAITKLGLSGGGVGGGYLRGDSQEILTSVARLLFF